MKAVDTPVHSEAELRFLAPPNNGGADSLLTIVPKSQAAMLKGRILGQKGLYGFCWVVGCKLLGE